MSNFQQKHLALPGVTSNSIDLSPGAWALLEKFQTMDSTTKTRLAVCKRLRDIRVEQGLSPQALADKITKLGFPFNRGKVRYAETAPPSMEYIYWIGKAFGSSPARIIMEAMEWSHPQHELNEVIEVYKAFGSRIQSNPPKSTRQLNIENVRLDSAINRAMAMAA